MGRVHDVAINADIIEIHLSRVLAVAAQAVNTAGNVEDDPRRELLHVCGRRCAIA